MFMPTVYARIFLVSAAFLALTAPGAQAATDTAKIEYEVVDGAVLVFGHRLETENPLPKIGDCEACGAIGFHPSPDGRWILIESDIRFTDADIWLYDASTGDKPMHVVDRRYGRHLQTNWLSDHVFEVRWIGMGYSRSLLFDARTPGERKALGDLLLYDPGRDVYVRYRYDMNTFAHEIEIGSAFLPGGEPERFPIVLDIEYRSDAIYQFENVVIEGPTVIVTHTTAAKALVSEEFTPKLLGAAR